MVGEGGHRWRVKKSRELRKRTRCPTWGSLQRGRRCNRYVGFQIYMCNVHRTWYQHMGLHHLQIRKGLSFMHATRQPPIQILLRIYIPSGDRSGGGGKVGDQGKDFAGGTTCRRKVHFCILSFYPLFLHCWFKFPILRYGLVPLPDQVERVDKAVAATQVITYNDAS